MNGLIGHTGFVGRHLARQRRWDASYNRANVDAMRGRAFDLLVCAGLPSDRWLANANPAGDRSNMLSLVNALAETRAERFVLVSTVDVYPVPVGVDESTPFEPAHPRAYGEHGSWPTGSPTAGSCGCRPSSAPTCRATRSPT